MVCGKIFKHTQLLKDHLRKAHNIYQKAPKSEDPLTALWFFIKWKERIEYILKTTLETKYFSRS